MPPQHRPHLAPAFHAFLFAAALAGAALAKEPTTAPGRDYSLGKEEDEKARRVQKEFQDAGIELAETHAAALRQPEIDAPLESLRKKMEEAMIRLEPDKKGQILKRYDSYREMTQIEKIGEPTALDKERYKDLLLDVTNLTEALGDLPKRATTDPTVMKEREKFHASLLAVMTKLNAKVPALLQQQKKSIEEYTELERDLLRKHGGGLTPLPPLTASPAPAQP